MPTGAGARTARTAGGDYSVTTQGVTAPVWNRKGAPRGTRSLVFSRRLAPIRHPARNTSTHSWAHARIPLDAPRGSHADPFGRPARTPSTRFMYSHTRGIRRDHRPVASKSAASAQQAQPQRARCKNSYCVEQVPLWGPTRGCHKILVSCAGVLYLPIALSSLIASSRMAPLITGPSP